MKPIKLTSINCNLFTGTVIKITSNCVNTTTVFSNIYIYYSVS